MAASASARGGNGCGGNGRGRGVEAGGGDAYVEMRKVRRGCIIGGGSVSRALGVSIHSEALFRRSSASRKGKRKEAYEL